jgi:hypothetical protein
VGPSASHLKDEYGYTDPSTCTSVTQTHIRLCCATRTRGAKQSSVVSGSERNPRRRRARLGITTVCNAEYACVRAPCSGAGCSGAAGSAWAVAAVCHGGVADGGARCVWHGVPAEEPTIMPTIIDIDYRYRISIIYYYYRTQVVTRVTVSQ